MTNELSRAPDAGTSEIEGREAPHAKLEWADASNLSVRVSGDFDRIEAACGNKAVMTALIEQAAALALHGKQIDQKATDFTLGYLDAMQPEDPAEALLLTQMAATHQLMMTLSRRLCGPRQRLPRFAE